jgi:hypothetical protein
VLEPTISTALEAQRSRSPLQSTASKTGNNIYCQYTICSVVVYYMLFRSMFVFLSVSFGHCIVLYGRHQFLITPFVSSNFSSIHGKAIIITFVLRAKLLFFASYIIFIHSHQVFALIPYVVCLVEKLQILIL